MHSVSNAGSNTLSFCGISHPALPGDVVQNPKTVCFRFHGVPELYKSKYSLAMLKTIANEIENKTETEEVYIYFNNDINGSAITNAHDFKAYIESLKK
ncbi:MAG: DUF72 domain-containing protein [Bacteroidota bacterium]|nr:DUF72 domain-containing protein [Bacteroidota bacterium]